MSDNAGKLLKIQKRVRKSSREGVGGEVVREEKPL